MKLRTTFPNWTHEAPQPIIPGAGYTSVGATSQANMAAVRKLTGIYVKPAGKSPSGTPYGRMRPYLGDPAPAPASSHLELYLGGAAALGLFGFFAWKKYA